MGALDDWEGGLGGSSEGGKEEEVNDMGGAGAWDWSGGQES